MSVIAGLKVDGVVVAIVLEIIPLLAVSKNEIVTIFGSGSTFHFGLAHPVIMMVIVVPLAHVVPEHH